jgi:hypothetical protein
VPSIVVEVRCFSWLGRSLEVDAERLGADPLGAATRFRLSISTTVLAEDALDAVARARAGRAAPASLDGVPVTSLELVGLMARLGLRHHVDPVTGLIDESVPPGTTKDWAEGDIALEVELRGPLDAKLPAPAYPAREGDVSFEQALSAARAERPFPLVLSGVREGQGGWFIPCRQIGSVGVVVDKRDGSTCWLPSAPAFEIEDWLWAYERGFRQGSAFVVTALDDVERAVEALIDLELVRDRWWTRRSLAQLPLSFDGALPNLRRLRCPPTPLPFHWCFAQGAGSRR